MAKSSILVCIETNALQRVIQSIYSRFFDPFLILVDAHRNDESRDAVIGLDSRWNLLYVVHIEQEKDYIRIISARKATRQERAEYES